MWFLFLRMEKCSLLAFLPHLIFWIWPPWFQKQAICWWDGTMQSYRYTRRCADRTMYCFRRRAKLGSNHTKTVRLHDPEWLLIHCKSETMLISAIGQIKRCKWESALLTCRSSFKFLELICKAKSRGRSRPGGGDAYPIPAQNSGERPPRNCDFEDNCLNTYLF